MTNAASVDAVSAGSRTPQIYGYEVRTIDGENITLAKYRGDVMLIVNVASKCGFTPQYKGLEELHRRFAAQGLRILGFPCNQFGGQEPGDEGQIKNFCRTDYGVTFDLFSKVEVNGAEAHPLFAYLKSEAPGVLGSEGIKWNFTKFLVDRSGKVVSRYAPTTAPEALSHEIEKVLL